MTIWIGYVLAMFAACGGLLFARWRETRGGLAAAQHASFSGTAVHHAPALPPNFADVAATAQAAIHRVGPLIASQFVGLDVAVPPGLTARMRESVLTDILEEMLASAIHAAPASRMLLTGLRQGDRIEIAITDDMAGADAAYRQGRVRDLSERVALRGGALQVAVQPAEGTTTFLRVLAAMDPAGVPAVPRPTAARTAHPAENSTP